jgi:hypothetical protein
MDSTVEMEGEERRSASPPTAAPAAAAPPMDEADFRDRFGPLLRDMIRDELERYLRNAAD